MNAGRPRRPARALLLVAALLAGAAAPRALAQTWLLPASARGPGLGDAFFTTDLTLASTADREASVTVRFFRHDEDGTFGPSVSYPLGPGQTLTLEDVLGSVFGFAQDWGALEVTSDSASLTVTSETSTRAPGGGTFGQSVPGFSPSRLVRRGAPAVIPCVREDRTTRTNLVVANAIDDQIVLHVALRDASGAAVGTGRDVVLPPFGMTQLTRVVEAVAGPGATLVDGQLVLSTQMPDAAFAAYAAVIDDRTNDPRTVLPVTASEPARTWLLPSSVHAPGAAGAFYTTDLTVANAGAAEARVTLQLLGHDADGTLGPQRDFTVGAGAVLVLRDVLATAFGAASDYGALLVTSDSSSLAVASLTGTPSPHGGTYGQGVPGIPASSFVRPGERRSLAGIREDASFRTNLVLASATPAPVTVHVELLSVAGFLLGSADVELPPLGMTQVGRVVKALLGPAAELGGGQLVVSTPTAGGAFAAYAATIDNTTNDPRTVLPD